MVADPAGLAHAGGGDDDLGLRVEVDHPRLVAGDGGVQVLEVDGVDALLEYRAGLCVEDVRVALQKDGGRFDGQGTVHIDREAVVVFDEALLLDLADVVQKLLGPAHGKRRDDHIAAAVQRALDHIGQKAHIVGRAVV